MRNLAAQSRRSFLRNVFLGGVALGAAPWPALAKASADRVAGELKLAAGPLAKLPPMEKKVIADGVARGIDDRLYAPKGFEVRCVARHGLDPLTMAAGGDGYHWHRDPDGGAVFPADDGGWVYACNSEAVPGGVGALRFDAAGNKTAAYRVLDNTRRNCAGGATPWGTWLSCEEVSDGLVYECDPFGSTADAVVKPALGAFPHEACAIDPIHHACYQTEDGGNQRFYRFVSAPEDLTDLPGGGKRMGLEKGELQVMSVAGFENGGKPKASDLRLPRRVNWVPAGGDAGTYFAGGEGLWYHEVPVSMQMPPVEGLKPTRGVMFFATKKDNRIYAYDIENALVEIVFDNDNQQQMSSVDERGKLRRGPRFSQVDNVVVSPAGDVVVAEDGSSQRLMVIVPNGQPQLLMQIIGGDSEITGPAFTPDGSRLYFNSQRGPDGVGGLLGATYEMHIPPEYRRRPRRG